MHPKSCHLAQYKALEIETLKCIRGLVRQSLWLTIANWMSQIPNPIQHWILYGVGSAHYQTLHVPNGLTFVIVTKVRWLQEKKAISAGIRSSKALSSPPHPMFCLKLCSCISEVWQFKEEGNRKEKLAAEKGCIR